MSYTLKETFWDRIAFQNECWIHSGPKVGRGYSLVSYKGKSEYAHRFSWELHYGLIPESLFVLHRCDNPPCVNPDHLFVGDQKENMRDCASKGRTRGFFKTNPVQNKKLTPALVKQIRVDKLKLSFKKIADKYGVSKGCICHVISGRSWRNA